MFWLMEVYNAHQTITTSLKTKGCQFDNFVVTGGNLLA